MSNLNLNSVDNLKSLAHDKNLSSEGPSSVR
jgi:hypothetical protein